MSGVMRTLTPFIDKELLIKAIESCGYRCSLSQNYLGRDIIFLPFECYFEFTNGRYVLVGSYYERDFLKNIEKNYNLFYKQKLEELAELRRKMQEEEERKRLEEEKRRLEEERKAFIENQKQEIIKKAKEKGYSIKEEKVGEKIKLVLRRVTY